MKYWCLCCRPQGSRPLAQSAVWPYLSQMLQETTISSSLFPLPHPPPPLSFFPLLLLANREVFTSHSCQSFEAPLSHLPVPLSSHTSLSLSVTVSPSIHLAPPFPIFFTLPLSLAHCPFPLCSGETVPCVLPGSLPAVPSFPSMSPFPFSLTFLPLIPCFPSLLPFLFPANFPASFSSYLPLSPSLSPPVSNHSPSISFSPSLHSCLLLHLSPPLFPSSLSPHLFLAWAQEQRTGVVSF